MQGLAPVIIAATAFVGSHFLLSHPLRRPIVSAVGPGAFLGVYSLVAAVTLVWVALAYRAAPATAPLWPVEDGLWAIVTVVMLVASIFLLGSLIRNPAMPAQGKESPIPETAIGVYSITRHPMMWAVALWGACHVAVFPIAANIVVAVSIAVLALVGAALQDRKKKKLQPDRWPVWEAKTSYWPFAAIVTRRARLGGFRPHEIAGGLVLWLAATWAHIPLSGWPAGIWRWVG